VIRKRTGFQECVYNSSSCVYESWNNGAADNQRFKTETFSLIDSLYPADSFTLMNPYQVVADPNTTFAAPTDTISDQTGILATDITAPVTVLPDTTEVTQPTDTEAITPGTDEGVTPPVATEDSNTLGITPGFGSIEAAPLGTLSDGVAAGEQGGTGAGEQGVLPESISTQTATDIQTPTDLSTGTLPDGVTPPDTGTLPPLGTTPSDNPTEVQLPADLSSSPLPPVETGVQVLEVAPPKGWRPSEDGSVAAFESVVCVDLQGQNGTYNRCFRVPDGLSDEAEVEYAKALAASGGNGNNNPAADTASEAAKALQQYIAERFGEDVTAKMDIINNYTQNLDPHERLWFYYRLGHGFTTGKMDEDDITEMADLVYWNRKTKTYSDSSVVKYEYVSTLKDELFSSVNSKTSEMRLSDLEKVWQSIPDLPNPIKDLGGLTPDQQELEYQKWAMLGFLFPSLGAFTDFVSAGATSLKYNPAYNGKTWGWATDAFGFSMLGTMAAIEYYYLRQDPHYSGVPDWQLAVGVTGKNIFTFTAGYAGAMAGASCGPWAVLVCVPAAAWS
jgi:hypothetical protein